jgi:excisionase family DNA binding protein
MIPNPETVPLLTVAQAADILGVSRSAAYRAATAGDLPTLRLSNRLYIPTAALRKQLHIDDDVADAS